MQIKYNHKRLYKLNIILKGYKVDYRLIWLYLQGE
jgi:hypothetical protein